MVNDTRIAYGARCTWWDSIDKVGLTKARDGEYNIPCCPICNQVLFEMADEETWNKGVQRYEDEGHPGYSDIVAWGRGKCFSDFHSEKVAYNAAQESK